MKNKPALTVIDIQNAIPSKKNTITQEIVDIINRSATEPEFQGESLLQTAITYENVMRNNSASMKDYLRAIKFCAYLITLDENFTEAYKKTFSDRDFVRNRLSVNTSSPEYRELTSASSRYRRSKLVVDILTLSQVPLDLMFTGARYKALGVLTDVMTTARQDRDKINAAKELLAATKGPENVKMELEVGASSEVINMQERLMAQLGEISAAQHKRLTAGEAIGDVQKLGITTEFIEVDIDA